MKPSADWKRRLRDFILDGDHRGRKEYSLNKLAEIADAPSTDQLSYEITTLVLNGLLQPIYRVRSRETGVGLEDYPSITKVPLEIYDDTAGVNQRVDLRRDIELLYRVTR